MEIQNTFPSLQSVVECIGENVLKQLLVVEPHFFETPYAIAKLVAKSAELQPEHYPFVESYDLIVQSSSQNDLIIGQPITDYSEILERVNSGTAIIASSHKIRGFINPSQEILAYGPFDQLVVAEVFGDCDRVHAIYNAATASKAGIFPNYFTCQQFQLAIARNYVHFAFLPAANRKSIYLENGWTIGPPNRNVDFNSSTN